MASMGTKNNDETKSAIDDTSPDTGSSAESAELATKSAIINIKTDKSIKKEKIDRATLDTGSLSDESADLVALSAAIKTEESIKKEKKDQINLDSVSLSLESLGISSTSVDSSKKDVEKKLKKPVTDVKDDIKTPIVRKRKLLVLNLNGVLVDVVFGYVPKADRRINNRSVFMRPFCKDFLKFCFEKFDVGIWSSKMSKNMVGVVDFLLGDLKNQLRFSWDQSYSTDTGLTLSQIGLVTHKSNEKPLFLMELKKIWNKYADYNESNTLLVDDTPYKSLLNPPHTAIFPEPYTYQLRNDCALGPQGDIRLYLEGLDMAQNVPKYVGQHPFGQTPMILSREITNKLMRK